MKKKNRKVVLSKKALIALIFSIGIIIGLMVSPYLYQEYSGAAIFTDPNYDPTSAACVRYNSTDETTVPPTPHRYECWETKVINETENGTYPDTMWQCYSDGTMPPDLEWYVPYSARGGECGNVM